MTRIAMVLWCAARMALDAAAPAGPAPLSPAALAVSPDGRTLFVAAATASQVLVFDTTARKVRARIAVSAAPNGLALSADGRRLYVTCAAPASRVAVIDVASGKVVDGLAAGHTATGPVLSPDGKTLYVCNRYNNDVSVIDLAARKEVRRVRVLREPVAAALTPDGRRLFVANFLHDGPADVEDVAASVSVIDTAAGRAVKHVRLPSGSGELQDVRVSPDGRYAVVSHVIGRFQVPTSQIERGWMNTNAVSILDTARLERVNTVLLDSVAAGAANPWGLAWTGDGKTLVAAHSGAHEVSFTDFPALIAKLAQVPEAVGWGKVPVTISASLVRDDVPTDLSFLTGLRRTIPLAETDRGPRAVAVAGRVAFAANYFSDTLTAIDMDAPVRRAVSVPLGPRPQPTVARRGEAYFHDATLCFQKWQSCAGCHPGEGRTDALNWDLLNDGIGNPKNSKSMLLAHRTPPAMSSGVRETAETAVRSGIRHILFTVQPDSVAAAIDVYLKSLRPVPSPRLVAGKLSPAAVRGKKIFFRNDVGCASCHPAGAFTDLKAYDVGTGGSELYDTPTLVEVWRTAPYLHDGSAATMEDVLTKKNRQDRHGRTSHLTPQQVKDLAEYVLSL